MRKQTHISEGLVNLTVTVPAEFDALVKKHAALSGLSRNKYVLTLLEDALSRGLLAREIRAVYEPRILHKATKKSSVSSKS